MAIHQENFGKREQPKSNPPASLEDDRLAADARRWQQLECRRDDLATWLIDQATNSAGELSVQPIDAALRGDDYVPCSFTFRFRGRRYRLSLIQTLYSVTEA